MLCVLIHSSAGFTGASGRNMLPPGFGKDAFARYEDEVKMLSEMIGKVAAQAQDSPHEVEEVEVEDENENGRSVLE